ncbi:hypothetical protein ACTHQ8_22690 [Lysinibacillus odysseyi]|uniref:hypothetical protein n=1 Tax=Lysinibacillus odysseyi TaxID=202611 RepID=UPI0007ABF6A6
MINPVETPVETPVVETPAVTPEVVVDQWEGGLMTSAIRSMIGTPPPGFEYIEYAVGAGIYIILFAIIAGVFIGFSKILGAK